MRNVGYNQLAEFGKSRRALNATVSTLVPAQFQGQDRITFLDQNGNPVGRIALDAAVVHTPGHTPGSSSLVVEGRIAFVGDLLSTSVRPRVQRSFADDWSLIPHSLARVQEFRPEWVYAGHGRQPLSRAALQRLTCRPPNRHHITTEEGR